MIRTCVARVVSFACFWLGRGISLPMYRWQRQFYWLYPAYNGLMSWSVSAEEWAGIEYMWFMPE